MRCFSTATNQSAATGIAGLTARLKVSRGTSNRSLARHRLRFENINGPAQHRAPDSVRVTYCSFVRLTNGIARPILRL